MILIIPYSHYYWVGGPPNLWALVGVDSADSVTSLQPSSVHISRAVGSASQREQPSREIGSLK